MQLKQRSNLQMNLQLKGPCKKIVRASGSVLSWPPNGMLGRSMGATLCSSPLTWPALPNRPDANTLGHLSPPSPPWLGQKRGPISDKETKHPNQVILPALAKVQDVQSPGEVPPQVALSSPSWPFQPRERDSGKVQGAPC